MKNLMRNSAFAAVATAFAASAAPAFADPQHCPPGHAKKGWCTPANDRAHHRDRWDDRRDEQRVGRNGQPAADHRSKALEPPRRRPDARNSTII